MPRPSERTRSRKRVSKKLPGGTVTTHYKKEIVAVSRCKLCSKPMAGIPRTSPSRTRKLNRSRRRIHRLYGGQICHNCLKSALRQTAKTL